MDDTTPLEDLRDRYVGQRFYNTEIDEACTVVGVDPPVVLFQYDDGVFGDEAIDADTLTDDVSDRAGVDRHGMDADTYVQLGPGPRTDQACDPDDHNWWPQPDDVWPEGPPSTAVGNRYDQFVRCRRCGLSGKTAMDLGLAHGLPWFCAVCEEIHDTTAMVIDTADHYDEFVCEDCIDTAGGQLDGAPPPTDAGSDE